MGLKEVIANTLAPSPVYIARSTNGNGSLRPLGLREAGAYIILNGKLPSKQPKLILDLSGGCAKGYIHTGLLIRLYTAGIEFDEARLISVANFVPVLEKTKDVKKFKDFSLEIPELIKPKSKTSLGKLADVVTHSRKSHFSNGEPVITHNGLYNTEKLEARLKQIYGDDTTGQYPKYHMLAMAILDEKTSRLVDLSVDYSKMPMVTASIGAISIPTIFPFVRYKGVLIQDAGYICNFPFEMKHLSDADTVIAVNLSYNAKCPPKSNYGGVEGIFINQQVQGQVRDRRYTEKVVQETTGITPEDLANRTIVFGPKVAIALPQTDDIPPGEIYIPPKRRLELIAQGEALGEKVLKMFRQPTVSFYIPFLNRYSANGKGRSNGHG